MILFIILSLFFLIYLTKRGMDFYLLFAAVCFVYFYPIIFFDKISFSEYLPYDLPVNFSAKLMIISGIIFLLITGLFVKKESHSYNSSYFQSNNFHIYLVSFFMIFLMVIIILENGVGLQGREKSEVMENLGYAYKLFNIVSCFVIAWANILKRRSLYFLAFLAIVFDLMFGFRVSMGEMMVMYFLSQNKPSIKKIYLWIFLGSLSILLLIIAKNSFYFTKNLGQVFLELYDSLSYSGIDLFMSANPESSTTSAVFNEIVANNFSIPPVYLLDSFLSFFPFLHFAGFEPVGFASYYKGVLFGAEGNSFASGMLSVSFALGSYFGVMVAFIIIALFAYFFNRIQRSDNLLYRTTAMAFGAIFILNFFRSDIIYMLGLLRSTLLFCFMLFIIRMLLNPFFKKRTSTVFTAKNSSYKPMSHIG